MRELDHYNIVKLSRTFEGISKLMQIKAGSSSLWSFATREISTHTSVPRSKDFSTSKKPATSSKVS